ncbi:hypothetical protein MYSI104531_26375 [Mycobacterium simiae]
MIGVLAARIDSHMVVCLQFVLTESVVVSDRIEQACNERVLARCQQCRIIQVGRRAMCGEPGSAEVAAQSCEVVDPIVSVGVNAAEAVEDFQPQNIARGGESGGGALPRLQPVFGVQAHGLTAMEHLIGVKQKDVVAARPIAHCCNIARVLFEFCTGNVGPQRHLHALGLSFAAELLQIAAYFLGRAATISQRATQPNGVHQFGHLQPLRQRWQIRQRVGTLGEILRPPPLSVGRRLLGPDLIVARFLVLTGTCEIQ